MSDDLEERIAAAIRAAIRPFEGEIADAVRETAQETEREHNGRLLHRLFFEVGIGSSPTWEILPLNERLHFATVAERFLGAVQPQPDYSALRAHLKECLNDRFLHWQKEVAGSEDHARYDAQIVAYQLLLRWIIEQEADHGD